MVPLSLDDEQQRREHRNAVKSTMTVGTGVLVTVAGVLGSDALLMGLGSGLTVFATAVSTKRWLAYRRHYPQ